MGTLSDRRHMKESGDRVDTDTRGALTGG